LEDFPDTNVSRADARAHVIRSDTSLNRTGRLPLLRSPPIRGLTLQPVQLPELANNTATPSDMIFRNHAPFFSQISPELSHLLGQNVITFM